MIYVLQNVASEDMVQLFAPSPAVVGTPVLGLANTDVTLQVRKAGESGFTAKVLAVGDFVDRGGGNYSIQFAAADFDVLGQFRFRLDPVVPGTFIPIEDSLIVEDEIPTFPADPPQINDQTDTPAGVTPDPVEQGATLTINGTDLGGATQVTIGGVVVPITANTASQIQVTVSKPPASPFVSLGDDQAVVVTTPGGEDTGTVDVVLDPADIPDDGCILLTGKVFDPSTCEPEVGLGVLGKVLDMPNISSGVMWSDRIAKTTTDANGDFSLKLPRSVRVEVTIARGRYRRVFVTPDLATANLFSEIP